MSLGNPMRSRWPLYRQAFTMSFLALACLVSSSYANAEPTPSLDLRHFRPPTDHRSGLYLEPANTPGPMAFSVGSWLSYAHHPVSIVSASDEVIGRPLAGQLSLDWFANLGVGERLALSLNIPSVIYQFEKGETGSVHTEPLPRFALGDISLGAKATLIPTDSMGGLGLALLAQVSAPTGDPRSYLGAAEPTGEFRALGEYTLIAASLYASAGAHLRPSEGSYLGETYGQSMPLAIGASLKPQALGWDEQGRWRWNLEVRSDLALSPKFARSKTSHTSAGVSARYTVGQVSAIVGAELPLINAIGTPAVRGIIGLSWAPRFEDMDGDGIEDSRDECPELPEDLDGFEDEDGCPDFDNDGDGVGDEDDRCPGELEDEDGFQDDDGCPDPDNDGDGIPDDQDECPDEAGPPGSQSGCPSLDRDQDGIVDSQDKCPDQPEDFDGFQDEDGCPDPDNDGDGIPDDEDACPDQAGAFREDSNLSGCPSPDRDGDSFEDSVDQCPNEPEDFDGVQDEDGCPDDDSGRPAALRSKPLLEMIEIRGEKQLKWRVAPKFSADLNQPKLDPSTESSVRALAQLLNQNPSFIAAIGVRPRNTSFEAEQAALNQAFVLVLELRSLTHRDSAAETVSWQAVKQAEGAARHGFGIMLLTPKAATATQKEAQPAASGHGSSEQATPQAAEAKAGGQPAAR